MASRLSAAVRRIEAAREDAVGRRLILVRVGASASSVDMDAIGAKRRDIVVGIRNMFDDGVATSVIRLQDL